MKQANLRLAKPEDAEKILKVLAPYIRDTAINFEYEVPDTEEYAKHIESISRKYPYIVCEIEGEIVGFAYASAHRSKSAYMWNAELSVYVDKDYLRLGIGHSLYSALIDILKLQNFENVYGVVTIPNENSEWLHRSMGFELVAVYRKTGFKLGRWHDVAWYVKYIGNHITPPRPVIPIVDLNESEVSEILNKNRKMVWLSGR